MTQGVCSPLYLGARGDGVSPPRLGTNCCPRQSRAFNAVLVSAATTAFNSCVTQSSVIMCVCLGTTTPTAATEWSNQIFVGYAQYVVIATVGYTEYYIIIFMGNFWCSTGCVIYARHTLTLALTSSQDQPLAVLSLKVIFKHEFYWVVLPTDGLNVVVPAFPSAK